MPTTPRPTVKFTPIPEAKRHVSALQWRNKPTLFEFHAKWVDTHREEAYPHIVDALKPPYPRSAIGILYVLRHWTDDPRVLPLLVSLLEDDDRLGFEAATSIAKLGTEEAYQALRDAAESDNEAVVVNAFKGMGSSGERRFCPILDKRLEDEGNVGSDAKLNHEKLGC